MGSEVWTLGGTLNLIYASDSSFSMSNNVNQNILTGDLTDDITSTGATSTNQYTAATNGENSAIQIRASSNFSGNASNDGTVTVTVWWTSVG